MSNKLELSELTDPVAYPSYPARLPHAAHRVYIVTSVPVDEAEEEIPAADK